MHLWQQYALCIDLGALFKTTKESKQGHPLSPHSFITYLESTMNQLQNNGSGSRVSVQRVLTNNLKFADDIDLLENYT